MLYPDLSPKYFLHVHVNLKRQVICNVSTFKNSREGIGGGVFLLLFLLFKLSSTANAAVKSCKLTNFVI